MGVIQVAVLSLFAFAIQTTQAQCVQCVNHVRQIIPTRSYVTTQPFAQQCPCPPSTSTEDLSKLILLAKMLIEKNTEQSAKNQINAEAIIKKLIDALIYTTVKYNNCRAILDKITSGGSGGNGGSGGSNGGTGGSSGGGSNSGGSGGSGSSNSGGSGGSGGNGGYGGSNGGTGGSSGGGSNSGGSEGSGSSNSGGSGGSGGSSTGGGGSGSGSGTSGNSKGVVGLNLLNPNSPDNLLDLILTGQNLLGIGLGDSGSGGSSTSGNNSNGTPSSSSSGGSGNSNKALIDLGILRPNQQDNVLDLGLAGTNLLGVKLGNSGSSGSSSSGSSNGGSSPISSSSGGGNSNKGLIDLDLLDPNSPDNVLDLNLAN